LSKLCETTKKINSTTTEMADAMMAHLNGKLNAWGRSKRQFRIQFQRWSKESWKPRRTFSDNV